MRELDEKIESQRNQGSEPRVSVEGAYHGGAGIKPLNRPENIFPDQNTSDVPIPKPVGSQAEITQHQPRAFTESEPAWPPDNLASATSYMDIYGNMDETMPSLVLTSGFESQRRSIRSPTLRSLPSPSRIIKSSKTPQEGSNHLEGSKVFGGSGTFPSESGSQNLGKTALHISSERGSLGIVQFLLLSGVDVNGTDNCGRTALHYAAHAGHLDIVSQLLRGGADLDARDHEGRSPLHLAAHAECEEVIRFLAQEGADLDAAIGISRQMSSEDDDDLDLDYDNCETMKS
ncbi:ankyrin repeat-containing protein, putative [Talaromyces stipitatus ATCC 10500]|nr:ankyrin repeat-containing protein, putative [Talaromyces stipitatus ATCC 10500]EED19839.1 ankyrin repeat-containing protein, putative [Talaromyces stipitatus ATCC 10500]